MDGLLIQWMTQCDNTIIKYYKKQMFCDIFRALLQSTTNLSKRSSKTAKQTKEGTVYFIIIGVCNHVLYHVCLSTLSDNIHL